MPLLVLPAGALVSTLGAPERMGGRSGTLVPREEAELAPLRAPSTAIRIYRLGSNEQNRPFHPHLEPGRYSLMY